MKRGLIMFFIVSIFIVNGMPLLTQAAEQYKVGSAISPKCSGLGVKGSNGFVNGACNYEDLIQLGVNVMGFAIYLMAILSVVALVYAGWLYMSSGGDEGNIKRAHGIFTNVALGIFLTLGAWLIVHQIVIWLGVGSDFTMV